MKNNKLIILIAISFSLLVNIPRMIFLFGSEREGILSLMQVSLNDTLLRIVSIFIFSLLILKYNIDWKFKIKRYKLIKTILINFIIFFIWISIYKRITVLVSDDQIGIIGTRFTSFVYILVQLMLIFISRTIELNIYRKQDLLEKEKLQKESLQNQLSVLKNQMNPHFLFNSLNSLSLLIREDQNTAQKFITKLATLYRTILQNTKQDLITIEEELAFLETYIYIIKHRYANRFNVTIDIDDNWYKTKIPALALQLLVENAVKHNIISKKKPLEVFISIENEMLTIKNKINLRKTGVESTHLGLSNLNTRYQLIFNKNIKIESIEDFFIVKLPLNRK